MSEKTPENQPPAYDNEQAKRFYRTATNPRHLPKKYWPGRDVEIDLFDAAVIQSYHDSVKHKRDEAREGWAPGSHPDPNQTYLRELARISAATEYVLGVPIEDINDMERDNLQMQKEGAFSYILHVAKQGAKEIKRLHAEDTLSEEHSVTNQATSERVAAQDQTLEILPEYKDLDDRIRKLYHSHRIDRESAQALILLLELQKSSASPERQIRALHNIRCELERKIMNWMFDREPQRVGETDAALETGIGYIRRVVGRPGSRSSGVRLHRLVKEMDAEIGGGSNQLQVRDHVYSHIGYALEKLYHL